MKLVLSAFLLISVTSILGTPTESCLRCICHARTGSFRLRDCANYSISRNYWTKAGKPTRRGDKDTDPKAYSNCIRNDNCILKAIRGYLLAMPDQDCNCDGMIDCKDYAAMHLYGDTCPNHFDQTKLTRLDTCLNDSGQHTTQGWSSCSS